MILNLKHHDTQIVWRNAVKRLREAGYNPYDNHESFALHYRRAWAKRQSDIVRRQRIK